MAENQWQKTRKRRRKRKRSRRTRKKRKRRNRRRKKRRRKRWWYCSGIFWVSRLTLAGYRQCKFPTLCTVSRVLLRQP